MEGSVVLENVRTISPVLLCLYLCPSKNAKNGRAFETPTPLLLSFK